MSRIVLLASLTSLAACGGTDGTSTDTDTSGGGGGSGLGLTAEATGDFSCFAPGADFASTTWLTQTGVQPAGTVDVDGVVQDFQTDEPRARRNVALWFDDVVDTTPDTTASVGTDQSGAVSVPGVPSCQPVAYRVQEETGLGEAKITYKAHQIYDPGTGGSTAGEFISVSNDTYALIPTIFGVDLDPAKGVIAGTAYDCTRDPSQSGDDDAGKVENVVVRVTDLQGQPLAGGQGRYFVQSFPDKNQPDTSADGLWGVFNLPEGDWRVEMWGLVGGEEQLLGATVARVYPDSINIANIFAGYGDGVKYPAGCLGGGGDTADSAE